LHDLLNEYVCACEKAETVKRDTPRPMNQQSGAYGSQKKSVGATSSPFYQGIQRSSADALFAHSKDKNNQNTKPKCRYCSKSHWGDECAHYKTIDDRKKCLKGYCFKCLKEGHSSIDCKSKMTCVYCNEISKHHRSLGQKKFKMSIKKESVVTWLMIV